VIFFRRMYINLRNGLKMQGILYNVNNITPYRIYGIGLQVRSGFFGLCLSNFIFAKGFSKNIKLHQASPKLWTYTVVGVTKWQ
jgi:hypothetical protein